MATAIEENIELNKSSTDTEQKDLKRTQSLTESSKFIRKIYVRVVCLIIFVVISLSYTLLGKWLGPEQKQQFSGEINDIVKATLRELVFSQSPQLGFINQGPSSTSQPEEKW